MSMCQSSWSEAGWDKYHGGGLRRFFEVWKKAVYRMVQLYSADSCRMVDE